MTANPQPIFPPKRLAPCPEGEHEPGPAVYPARNDGLMYCAKCKWVYDVVENAEERDSKREKND